MKSWQPTVPARRRGATFPAPDPGLGAGVTRALLVTPVAVSLLIYLQTIAPGLLWGDSPELALQAYRLGTTHAPGYPLHTLLGFPFAHIFSEPILGVNVLSAMATCVSVALLVRIAHGLCRNAVAALIAALAFALVPVVWHMAIITEVYAVNTMATGAALAAALAWHERPTRARLIATGVTMGVLVGASLANALLVPGLIWLVAADGSPGNLRRFSLRRVATVCVLMLGVAMVFTAFTLVRSMATPPMGTRIVPASLSSLWAYVSGSQYGAFGLQEPRFYAHRLREHVPVLLSAYLWIGLVPAWIGARALWRRDRRVASSLALMFVANFGFFTFYRWSDYQWMVTPSYLLFAIVIAAGLARLWLGGRRNRVMIGFSGIALLAAVQLQRLPEMHRVQAESETVTAFVDDAFDVFPENAVVAARWRFFTPLVYVQEIRARRSDVTLIERSDGPRRYAFGDVPSWRAFVARQLDERPVIVDTPFHGLGLHDAALLNAPWHRLVRASSKVFELPGTVLAVPPAATQAPAVGG